MKYIEVDEQGKIKLDAEGIPISTNFISRIRKYPLAVTLIKFLERQNFHLRGIIPGLILVLTRMDVKDFSLDSLLRVLVFIWIVGACLTGFMLAYLGSWNISTRQFDAIEDRGKRIEYFSIVENIKKRREEGLFYFYYPLLGCVIFYWLLAYNS